MKERIILHSDLNNFYATLNTEENHLPYLVIPKLDTVLSLQRTMRLKLLT